MTAELIVTGRTPELIRAFDLNRFHEGRLINERAAGDCGGDSLGGSGGRGGIDRYLRCGWNDGECQRCLIGGEERQDLVDDLVLHVFV